MTRGNTSGSKCFAAALGFEIKLWLAKKHNHIVLGFLFLKNIPGSFDEHHANLVAGRGEDAN